MCKTNIFYICQTLDTPGSLVARYEIESSVVTKFVGCDAQCPYGLNTLIPYHQKISNFFLDSDTGLTRAQEWGLELRAREGGAESAPLPTQLL